MLEKADNQCASSRFGAKLLVVRGRRFKNSAAKFWSALIDELLTEYAGCRSVVLEAVNEGQLDPVLLFPELDLEREVNRINLSAEGIRQAWQKALEDFELCGPPGAVGLRFYSADGKQLRFVLPMDCVDAELFLYLLVWLLEWSDLPLSTWNEPRIKGSFSAVDPVRRLKYTVHFIMEHSPLKEGLITWKLELQFKRDHLSKTKRHLRTHGAVGQSAF